jgi:hypothetical protein
VVPGCRGGAAASVFATGGQPESKIAVLSSEAADATVASVEAVRLLRDEVSGAIPASAPDWLTLNRSCRRGYWSARKAALCEITQPPDRGSFR